MKTLFFEVVTRDRRKDYYKAKVETKAEAYAIVGFLFTMYMYQIELISVKWFYHLPADSYGHYIEDLDVTDVLQKIWESKV